MVPKVWCCRRFLASYFELGPSALQSAARKLSAVVLIDEGSVQFFSSDLNIRGISIIGAALFRAVQGSLPPWAVESIPEVYCSLFAALDKDPTRFEQILGLSMEVRLSQTVEGFGGVKPGQLLKECQINRSKSLSCRLQSSVGRTTSLVGED